MRNFYIEKLIISGGEHENTELDFVPGVNFILGPSNTGKSLVLDCIDYVFGNKTSKDKPSKIEENNGGYTHIQLNIRSKSLNQITIRRKIGETSVEVYSDDPSVKSGEYSINTSKKKNTINDIFLSLIGVDETPQILKNLDGKKINLTWRSILYLFLLKQTDVDRETSALLSPISTASTSSKSALLYLLTGKDAADVPEIESAIVKNAKKEVISQFLQEQIDKNKQEHSELRKQLEIYQEFNLEEEMNFIRFEISHTQEEINKNIRKEREIIKEINLLSNSLIECKTLKESFSTLYGQYQSDIERIKFILTGANLLSDLSSLNTCPICHQEIHEEFDVDYLLACSTELEKLKENSTELSKTLEDLEQKQQRILKKIQSRETEKELIQYSLNNIFTPTLNSLSYNLEKLSEASKLQAKYDVVRENIGYYSTLQRNEASKKEEITKPFSFEDKFDIPIFLQFEQKLRKALIECHIGGSETFKFNTDVFDFEINGKKKAVSMGGGYNSILNTLMALTMSETLVKNNCKAPGFFIVDSVLTQLSESEHLERSETIKENFINYLINNVFNEQIIIVEQKKRMPFIPNDKGMDVKVTEFTGKKYYGRYGFLNDVYNNELY